jgi:hypothetical protein
VPALVDQPLSPLAPSSSGGSGSGGPRNVASAAAAAETPNDLAVSSPTVERAQDLLAGRPLTGAGPPLERGARQHLHEVLAPPRHVGRGRASRGLRRQHLGHQLDHRGIRLGGDGGEAGLQVGVELARQQHRAVDLLERHPVEQAGAGEPLEQDAPEGVHVGRGLDPLLVEALGRHVQVAAHHRVVRGLGLARDVGGPGDAEVEELDLAVATDADVRGLDVAVDEVDRLAAPPLGDGAFHATSSAAATSPTTPTKARTGMGGVMQRSRSSPSTYSVTSATRSSSRTRSCTRRIAGWRRAPSRRPSSRRRLTESEPGSMSPRNTLMATSARTPPLDIIVARYTSPNPPRPRQEWTWNRRPEAGSPDVGSVMDASFDKFPRGG